MVIVWHCVVEYTIQYSVVPYSKILYSSVLIDYLGPVVFSVSPSVLLIPPLVLMK